MLSSLVLVAACDGDPITAKVMSGASTLHRTRPAECAGGTVVEIGLDDDKDKVLSDSEVDVVIPLCPGATGPQGEQGPTGAQGADGKDGVDGANGRDGAAGMDGAQGAAGPAGPPGPAGMDGAVGAPGESGPPGAAGVDGARGPAGEQGAPGQDGVNGVDGQDGANGRDGAAAAFRQEPVLPGDLCARGGVRLAYGADDDHDGLLGVTEDDGAVLVCSPDCGAYQCGGACGVCGAGYTCGAGLCGDVDECSSPEPVCGANAVCSNTPGAFSCACLDGYEGDGRVCTPIPTCTGLVCDTGCVQPAEDVANCGACGIQCGTGQACVAGVCVGSGQLRFSSTWSRPGDIDVWVTTPSGASIGWQQQTADGGRQDRDDTSGTGPENIYWEVSPVSGTYSVCVATNYARPTAAAPVTVRVVVARPSAEDETLEATYTDSRAFDRSQKCTPAHPTYLGSVVVE